MTLTTEQSAHIMRGMLQYMRVALETNPQFSVANLATLMAIIEFNGEKQYELASILGGVDLGVLSRQIRILRAERAGVTTSTMKSVVDVAPDKQDNRVNMVFLTEEGETFATKMTRELNRLLKQAMKT